ncbi:MAG: hypothetical protein EKK49_07375 [Rhodocyclaceae bacterium]|nr:MAG: hypothetical protein EKK49_07375 [Rhodocyclaceae bacterium]
MSITVTLADTATPGQRAYRAFMLGEGGAIRSAVILDARTDEEARSLAAGLANTFGIDLWERTRFLGRYPPLAAT